MEKLKRFKAEVDPKTGLSRRIMPTRYSKEKNEVNKTTIKDLEGFGGWLEYKGDRLIKINEVEDLEIIGGKVLALTIKKIWWCKGKSITNIPELNKKHISLNDKNIIIKIKKNKNTHPEYYYSASGDSIYFENILEIRGNDKGRIELIENKKK